MTELIALASPDSPVALAHKNLETVHDALRTVHPKAYNVEHRAWWTWRPLPSGYHCGVFIAKSGELRKELMAIPGVVVLPPLHRPVGADFCGALNSAMPNLVPICQATDIAYDVMERMGFDPERHHH